MDTALKKALEGEFLPDGFAIRPAVIDDLSAITTVLRGYEEMFEGRSDTQEEDLLADWDKPRFELERDAWVITAPGGNGSSRKVVAYQEIWNREGHFLYSGDGYVMPGYFDLGIGTTMLRIIDIYVQRRLHLAPTGQQVLIRNGVMGNDPAAHELHENEGYQPVRYFWEMETVMESPPEAPVWPEGISVRNYVPGEDDRATFDAFEEAFRDHWGYSPWDYDEWHTRRHERDHFDPGLWWLAMDAGEIAGGVICRYRQERGWISQLAVRKPWRRRGLGTALLLNSLGEFYRRGRNTVALGVDADNPTGATLVYERAGMYINSKFVVYEKEIRPGLKVRE